VGEFDRDRNLTFGGSNLSDVEPDASMRWPIAVVRVPGGEEEVPQEPAVTSEPREMALADLLEVLATSASADLGAGQRLLERGDLIALSCPPPPIRLSITWGA